jgi:hypothetical protein
MSSNIDNDTVPIVRAKLDSSSEVKRGRGRPAKYAPEEREQKYKNASKIWKQEHNDRQNKLNTEYLDRSRFAYRLLCDMWNKQQLDLVTPEYKHIIQQLVENKNILSV